MSRLATSFVLGYHGCEAETALQVIAGRSDIRLSDKNFDWLGPGAYFWEADPKRALEWAQWKVERREYKEPGIVGAVIDLRNCLDLVASESLDLLRDAHASYLKLRTKSGLPMPENKSAPGNPNEDRVLRFLDCAVIKHLHAMMADAKDLGGPFDTVRGMFTEGGVLYPGAGVSRRSHVQIAVLNTSCILGFFRPRPYPRL